jgi:uncharacterized protein
MGKMISNFAKERIITILNRIEADEAVCILYACESGSRAWGFESKNSDFDVRFIYLRPPSWYLSVQKKRDVIEVPIDNDLDVSGWDLSKALDLFRKSNPPLLEWLQSPIIYKEKGSAVGKLRDLMRDYYAPISCMHHYLHMAQGNYREYLHGDVVWIKKYFYVLRPVLACMWIEQGLGVVPMEFEMLVDRLITDTSLRKAINRLLILKRDGQELDKGKRIDELSEFIDQQISRLSIGDQRPPHTKDPKTLDALFIEILIETYGNNIEHFIGGDANNLRSS